MVFGIFADFCVSVIVEFLQSVKRVFRIIDVRAGLEGLLKLTLCLLLRISTVDKIVEDELAAEVLAFFALCAYAILVDIVEVAQRLLVHLDGIGFHTVSKSLIDALRPFIELRLDCLLHQFGKIIGTLYRIEFIFRKVRKDAIILQSAGYGRI